MTSRRKFLDSMALGATALAAMPAALAATPAAHSPDTGRDAYPALPPDLRGLAQDTWDTTWGTRLTGKVKTCFDVPEIEAGFPVWRASIWAGQYQDVLKAAPKDLSTALVLRHNAIFLAMQQSFWDKYGTGKAHKVTHPLTGQPTDKNPALMGAADGVAAPFSDFALDKFLGRGGVALACNLALQFLVVPVVQQADAITPEAAYTKAKSLLVPGVILQPSGMFAVMRAQEAGCYYFRAS